MTKCVQVLAILAAVIASSQQQGIGVPCAAKPSYAFLSLADCEQEPCPVTRGKEHVMQLSITPVRTVTNGNLLITHLNGPVHRVLENQKETTIKALQSQALAFPLNIPMDFPVGKKQKLHMQIVGDGKVEYCVQFDVIAKQ